MRYAHLAVADTNILVSALLSPHGNEARVVDLFRQQLLVPAISTDVLAEYRSVLGRAKFGFNPVNIRYVLSPFLNFGLEIEPQQRLFVSPHESDNRLLECAEAAKARYLITGDLRHFPAVHGVTRIMNARTFLEIFEATE